MDTTNLPSTVKKPQKRIGRGHGSGRVKTSGRGTKGQNARGKMPRDFEGGQLALVKRLPLLRGKQKNHVVNVKAVPISVGLLEKIPAKTKVTLETLVKYHIIEKQVSRVKILGGGSVSHAVTVTVPCSQSARKVIEKAGGTVEV